MIKEIVDVISKLLDFVPSYDERQRKKLLKIKETISYLKGIDYDHEDFSTDDLGDAVLELRNFLDSIPKEVCK